jgi:hypothetical protein
VVAVIGAFLAVIGGAVANLIQGILSDKLIGRDVWLVGAILFALALIVYMVQRIEAMITELRDKARLSIRYYSNDNTSSGRELYNAARKVIDRADPGSRIFAINSFVEVFKESMDASAENSRRGYLESIEELLGSVDYHRIIQLKPSDLDQTSQTPLHDLIASNYLTHYRNVATYMSSRPHDTRLTRLDAVPAVYPTSFVLVQPPNDDRGGSIIWQMNEHVLSNGNHNGTIRADALKLTGVFIINDPDGLLVGYFKQWFNELQRSRGLRAITDEELGLAAN